MISRDTLDRATDTLERLIREGNVVDAFSILASLPGPIGFIIGAKLPNDIPGLDDFLDRLR